MIKEDTLFLTLKLMALATIERKSEKYYSETKARIKCAPSLSLGNNHFEAILFECISLSVCVRIKWNKLVYDTLQIVSKQLHFRMCKATITLSSNTTLCMKCVHIKLVSNRFRWQGHAKRVETFAQNNDHLTQTFKQNTRKLLCTFLQELLYKDMSHLPNSVCLSVWPEFGYSKWTFCHNVWNLSECFCDL